jgi:hypothetical protein
VNPALRSGFLVGVLVIALSIWVIIVASNGSVLFGGICTLVGGVGWSSYLLVFTWQTAGEPGLARARSDLRTDPAWAPALTKIAMVIGVVGLIVGVAEALFAGAMRNGLYTAGVGVLVIVSSLALARRQAARRRRS